jgi:ABC-type amino acid transport substrate-binding protein
LLLALAAAAAMGMAPPQAAPAARGGEGTSPAARQAEASGAKGADEDARRRAALEHRLPPIPPGTVLRVGTCDLPPWSIPPSRPGGQWSGLAVQAWRMTAESLQVRYELKQYGFDELRAALGSGEIDVAATGVGVVPENLVEFTLTPALDSSGISVATRETRELAALDVVSRVLQGEVLWWFAIMGVFILLFSLGLWVIERRRNPPLQGNPLRGIGAATWWSVTTLTTVGYGDHVPVTWRGKALAMLWMTLGFVLLTISSAVVTSVLTVHRMKPLVSAPADLVRTRVGVVTGTIGERYANRAGIDGIRYETFETALAALEHRDVDAVIGATAVLDYLVARSKDADLVVLPKPLYRGYVALGMRFGLDDAIEKRIELELLRVEQSAEFRSYHDALMGNQDTGQGPQGGTTR